MKISIAILLIFSFTVSAQTTFDYIDENTPTSRYILNNDGTAIDNNTGLMWMRCGVEQIWDSSTVYCSGIPFRP